MTAFIAAEIQEFIGLRRHLRHEQGLRLRTKWAVEGELNGSDVILAANGPGPELSGQAVRAIEENKRLDALVSYGFCGALDPALAVTDIIVGSEIQGETPLGAGILACRFPRRRAGMPAPQRFVSVDRVVTTAHEKAQLRRSGAGAVEMEASALASYAKTRGIPFYCIRVVTDSATEDFPIDFNRVRDSEGRFSRFKIIAQAARNPFKLIPELIQLNRRANAAALKLGDFVARCEF